MIPVASGHLVDPHSLRLDDRQLPVFAVATGQPAVQLDSSRSGTLRYRSGPGASGEAGEKGTWPPLPQQFADFSRVLEGLPPADRALEAAEFVRRRIAYDTSPKTVARHRQARERSIGLFDRAAEIGAGDCDVQNALVAAVLERSGVPSRLAVGWIGAGGQAKSGLHAWAEFLGADGEWRAVDASAGGPATGPVTKVSVAGEADTGRLLSILPGWLPISVLSTLALVSVVAFLGGRRWRRSFQAGRSEDFVGLVRGAAVRPHAFEGIYPLFSRRLLGLVSGRSISLTRASALARRGRLACGSHRSRLARRAARGGGVVLDLDCAESAAAATALAAVNLDDWHELLDRSIGDGLTAHVQRRLAAAGEPCRIVIADRVGLEIAVLEGAAFGLGGDARWVVIDTGSRLWESVCGWAGPRPARAALLLADVVVHRTGAPPALRQRCLAKLALEALREAAGAS
jgi:hypothetical protein